VPVSAELRRKNAQGDLVDYVLVDDGENLQTELSDPTVDHGVRSRLSTIASQLANPVNTLVPAVFDHLTLSYTGDDLTGIVYRQGGTSGTVVATLALGYAGGRLTTVART
jgi:hypothetical protein